MKPKAEREVTFGPAQLLAVYGWSLYHHGREKVNKILSETSLQLQQKADTEQQDDVKCGTRTLQADAMPI